MPLSRLCSRVLLAGAIVLGLAAVTHAATTFTPISTLGGSTNQALAVSPDGAYVAGSSTNASAQTEAFLYTVSDSTLLGLGFPDVVPTSTATGVAVTAGGVVKVCVNSQIDITGTKYNQAFIWASDIAGYTGDFILLPTGFNSVGNGIAVDFVDGTKTYVTGWADDSLGQRHNYRYRDDVPSMLDCAKAPDALYTTNNRAVGASCFGELGGSSDCTIGGGRHRAAWWWSPAGGGVYNWLDNIAGPIAPTNEGIANAYSYDGLHVVGRSMIAGSSPYWHAFRQNGPAAVEDCGVLTAYGHNYSEAFAVSGAGHVVAGTSTSIDTPDPRVFIWDRVNGMRELSAVLTANGVNLSGWTLTNVRGISFDGTVLCGTGTFGGATRAWVVTGFPAPALPAPAVAPHTNDTIVSGYEYVTTASLREGRIPTPTWSKVAGPAAVVVTGGTSSAAISGWVTSVADIATSPHTITVEASSANGTGTGTWTVTVIPPPPPQVVPAILDNVTSVTVSGIETVASEVKLFKNGVVVATATAPGADFSTRSYTFTNLPPHAVNDYYAAQQISGGASGDDPTTTDWYENKYYKGRCVQPATLSFFDSFETPVHQGQWWLRHFGIMSNLHAHTGSQSLMETTDPPPPAPGAAGSGAGESFCDVTPTSPNEVNPVVLRYWMYEEAGGIARHRCGVNNLPFGGWTPEATTVDHLLEIGCFDKLKNPPAGQVYDVTRYHGRCVTDKGRTQTVFNLVDLSPERTTGWHQFSIKLQDDNAIWYVDGKRGGKVVPISPLPINWLRVANWSGSPDGKPCWYDDVEVVRTTQHSPVCVASDINVSEGVAMTPVELKGVDPDTPDTVHVKWTVPSTLPPGATDAGLPPGLNASVAADTVVAAGGTPTTGPEAAITISGSPESGTAGKVYAITFTAYDDYNVTATQSVLITVTSGGSACNTPRADLNGDGSVDGTDFGIFGGCFNGSGNPITCGEPCADMDEDGDVDGSDFGIFGGCFNGSGNPPSC